MFWINMVLKGEWKSYLAIDQDALSLKTLLT